MFLIMKRTPTGGLAWDGYFDDVEGRPTRRFDQPPETELAKVRRYYRDASWFIARPRTCHDMGP